MRRRRWPAGSWLAVVIVALAALAVTGCRGGEEAATPSPTAIPGVLSGALFFLASGNYTSDIYRVNADGSGLAQLTDSPSGDFGAAWSPDGSQIAFLSSGRGNEPYSDVYVMKPDGSDLRDLTNARRHSLFVSWSPDGSRLLFSQDGIGPEDFWVMNADGSNAVRVMAENRCWSEPDWSPDGSRILACQCESGERTDDCWLMVVGSDGANPRSIEGVRGPIRDPELSPDGRRVLYVEGRTSGQGSVYVVDVEGGTPQKVYDGAIGWGDSSPPAWSPDGSRIAIAAGTELLTVSADGTERRAIVNVAVSYFAWSPDGTRIAYISEDEGTPQLYVVDIEGGTPMSVSGGPVSLSPVHWSPDGRQLLFASDRKRQRGAYWISPDGSETRLIQTVPPGPADDLSASAIGGCKKREGESRWECLSPDGRRLVSIVPGVAGEGTSDRLVVTDLATGMETDMTPPGLRLMVARPAWSPDGRRIAFRASTDEDCGLYWMDSEDGEPKWIVSLRGPTACYCQEEDVSLLWSPDGKYMYYTKGALKGEGCAPGFLYRVRLDGTGEEQLTDMRVVSLLGFAP